MAALQKVCQTCGVMNCSATMMFLETCRKCKIIVHHQYCVADYKRRIFGQKWAGYLCEQCVQYNSNQGIPMETPTIQNEAAPRAETNPETSNKRGRPRKLPAIRQLESALIAFIKDVTNQYVNEKTLKKSQQMAFLKEILKIIMKAIPIDAIPKHDSELRQYMASRKTYLTEYIKEVVLLIFRSHACHQGCYKRTWVFTLRLCQCHPLKKKTYQSTMSDEEISSSSVPSIAPGSHKLTARWDSAVQRSLCGIHLNEFTVYNDKFGPFADFWSSSPKGLLETFEWMTPYPLYTITAQRWDLFQSVMEQKPFAKLKPICAGWRD